MFIIGMEYLLANHAGSISEEQSPSIDYYGYLFLEIYIIAALICFIFSTFYHWFSCISEVHHSNLLRLDLTGIALLVGGSFLPATYFGILFHQILKVDSHINLQSILLHPFLAARSLASVHAGAGGRSRATVGRCGAQGRVRDNLRLRIASRARLGALLALACCDS